MKVAIFGGGAAGFFAAIAVKENHPSHEVIILEKSTKVLSKVKVSGGGRCNVTNGCSSISELCKAYPRGGKKLKKIFSVFNTQDTIEWFKSRGVPTYEEPDGRVFPVSQNSQTIIDCFQDQVRKLKIQVELQEAVNTIKQMDGRFLLQTSSGKQLKFDKVIITTGGSPKSSGLDWIKELGHQIEVPVPSLFTFNLPLDPVTKLMGLVAPNAIVSLQGSKVKTTGPLLITHWGMSGPAILKLSAFEARTLFEKDYQFNFQVNWIGESNYEQAYQTLEQLANSNSKKLMSNLRLFELPERLWLFLLDKAGLPASKQWGEIGKKGLNKLTNILTNDNYKAAGKTTFKEEFVTCGGVSLESVDLNTMQSKVIPNLYFAGEVLDIDAITGGYNFQAAWSTGFIAGKLSL
ncbi:MAG: NAD(P)/FAD-dependent oxidoreductase [Bacteroidota bacterium]